MRRRGVGASSSGHHAAGLLVVGVLACVALACREETAVGPLGGGGAGVEGGGGSGGDLGGAGGGPLDADLTLMTWNLENFPKSGQTVDAVEAILDAHRPDVIGLQELPDDSSWQALDEALPDYQGLVASQGDGYMRVGILYRPERVAINDPETLFTSQDYAFPRAVLSAHVALADDPSRVFTFAVVHLKAQLDQESVDRRRTACVALDQWISEQQAAGLADEVVVAGDFNDELTDPPAWNVFGPLLQSVDGRFLTLSLEQGGEHTYLPFTSFIDHVLVRGATLPLASSAEVLHLDEQDPSYVARVSDHRPVLVKLRF